ncbi:MAG: hypothetical protein ACK5MW_05905 [Enterococcus sp.]
MSDYSEIKRKHFRFPAYEDELGVKIKSEKPTNFSNSNDWILTEVEEASGLDLANFKHPEVKRESATVVNERALRRSKKTTTQQPRPHNVQKDELSRHRSNLPDYHQRQAPEVSTTGKKTLFGDLKRSTPKAQATKVEKQDPSLKREYSGRSYFVPKYIPASILPDEEKEQVTTAEIVDAMAKAEENYLLFDQEPAAYLTKKESDPSVRKFKKTTGEIKKRAVMDRSLKGLIEDEKDLGQNGYFNKK